MSTGRRGLAALLLVRLVFASACTGTSPQAPTAIDGAHRRWRRPPSTRPRTGRPDRPGPPRRRRSCGSWTATPSGSSSTGSRSASATSASIAGDERQPRPRRWTRTLEAATAANARSWPTVAWCSRRTSRSATGTGGSCGTSGIENDGVWERSTVAGSRASPMSRPTRRTSSTRTPSWPPRPMHAPRVAACGESPSPDQAGLRTHGGLGRLTPARSSSPMSPFTARAWRWCARSRRGRRGIRAGPIPGGPPVSRRAGPCHQLRTVDLDRVRLLHRGPRGTRRTWRSGGGRAALSRGPRPGHDASAMERPTLAAAGSLRRGSATCAAAPSMCLRTSPGRVLCSLESPAG